MSFHSVIYIISFTSAAFLRRLIIRKQKEPSTLFQVSMAQDSKTSCSVLCCIKLVCHTLMPYSIAGSGRCNLRNLYRYSDFFFASSAFYVNAVSSLYCNKLAAFTAQLLAVYNIFYKNHPAYSLLHYILYTKTFVLSSI